MKPGTVIAMDLVERNSTSFRMLRKQTLSSDSCTGKRQVLYASLCITD